MRYRFIALALCLLFGSNVSVSAGFDCSLPGLSLTEKTICGNTYLSGLDNVLNKFFQKAYDSSLSHGSLTARQTQWIKERDSCRDDINCITNSYLTRNQNLAESNNLQSVNAIFNREGDQLDEVLDAPITTKSGFTITDTPWRVKEMFSSESFEGGINLEGKRVSGILTYQEINNDLYIYIAVSGRYQDKNTTLIVELKDDTSPRIIQQYDGDIDVISRTRDRQGNALAYFSIGSDSHKDYHYIFISPANGKGISDISSEQAEAMIKKATPWIGYCGDSACDALSISPDSKWRLASHDSNDKDQDEGIYVFPANRPDLGLNVFTDKNDNVNDVDDFTYTRQYVWDDDSDMFYFTNDGALCCIWKTDITSKTTKRILPVVGALDPFYINYEGESFILFVYSYSCRGDFKSEIYIAKESN